MCGFLIYYLRLHDTQVPRPSLMQEVQSPHIIPKTSLPKVFLAGSIEMGLASEWQMRIIAQLKNESVMFLNPRRQDWDAAWKQDKENSLFREQVEWELNALSESDYIILYLDPSTKSPISLLEMGLYARSGKLFVVCPPGFWRKGNVDIVCEKYNIPQFASLDLIADHLLSLLNSKKERVK